MTNDGWGSKWPVALEVNPSFDKAADKAMRSASAVPSDWQNEKSTLNWSTQPSSVTWDKATGSDKTTIAKIENGAITKVAELKSQGSNLVDNEAYLYFQCDRCGEILDPHTKSFQTLQEHRVNAGWKCVWNLSGMGYKVYCAECEGQPKDLSDGLPHLNRNE